MALSTALHISYTVRAATDTAVRASISTPVLPSRRHSARISMAQSGSFRVSCTSTCERVRGWQSGIRCAVCFAPIIPASWATDSTSPFFSPPDFTVFNVSCDMVTRPPATATRRVSAFSPTFTICGRPSSVKWVKSDIGFAFAVKRERDLPVKQR